MSDLSQVTRLAAIMARLRAPGGCPWDREQTPLTLKTYVLEEAYEVIDAIDQGDPEVLKEELGDLLLQVVFLSQIGAERGWFSFNDVAQSISDKMERRHPHVFGEEELNTPQEVGDRWEEIKAREGRSALGGVPRSLPALLRAARVTEKAARIGFDWERTEDVLDKVEEETGELRAALKEGRREDIDAELGDLFFSLANFARHLDMDPEDCLRRMIDRFTTRFNHVETSWQKRSGGAVKAPIEVLEALWEEAKEVERASALSPSETSEES